MNLLVKMPIGGVEGRPGGSYRGLPQPDFFTADHQTGSSVYVLDPVTGQNFEPPFLPPPNAVPQPSVTAVRGHVVCLPEPSFP